LKRKISRSKTSNPANSPAAGQEPRGAKFALGSKLWQKSTVVLLPLGAVTIALLLSGIILLAMGANPLEAYAAIFDGAFGSVNGITTTLAKATPLLLIALGFAIARHGGVINIGGGGQFTVGALASTAVCLSFSHLPAVILFPLTLLSGALAGGLWGAIPGILRAKRDINEVITTVMMNQIALRLSNYLLGGPMIDPEEIERGTRLAQSAEIPSKVWLERLIPQTLLHSGIFIAILMALIVFVFLWQTTIGYRIRAAGKSPDAAKYAGINVPFFQVLSLALAGSLAGLAGSIDLLGIHRRMIGGMAGSLGFSGVVVALLGKLHPLGVVPASFLFGGLLTGADKMQRAVQVPSTLIQVILGLTVLLVVSSEFISRRREMKRTILEEPVTATQEDSEAAISR
jgi:general nucleoside transport system permease protein